MFNSKITKTVLMSALLLVPAFAANIESDVLLRVGGAELDKAGNYVCQAGDLMTLAAQGPAESLVGIFAAPLNKFGHPEYENGAFLMLEKSLLGAAEITFQIPKQAAGSSFVLVAMAMNADQKLLLSERVIISIDAV